MLKYIKGLAMVYILIACFIVCILVLVLSIIVLTVYVKDRDLDEF